MQRDFVLQLRPEADPLQGRIEGRLEHVDSGRSAHFSNLDEFLALLVRLLPKAAEAEPLPPAAR